MLTVPSAPWLWPWLGALVVYSVAFGWVLVTPQLLCRPRRPALIPRQRCAEGARR